MTDFTFAPPSTQVMICAKWSLFAARVPVRSHGQSISVGACPGSSPCVADGTGTICRGKLYIRLDHARNGSCYLQGMATPSCTRMPDAAGRVCNDPKKRDVSPPPFRIQLSKMGPKCPKHETMVAGVLHLRGEGINIIWYHQLFFSCEEVIEVRVSSKALGPVFSSIIYTTNGCYPTGDMQRCTGFVPRGRNHEHLWV